MTRSCSSMRRSVCAAAVRGEEQERKGQDAERSHGRAILWVRLFDGGLFQPLFDLPGVVTLFKRLRQ